MFYIKRPKRSKRLLLSYSERISFFKEKKVDSFMYSILFILFWYIWTILFHMSRNEMVLQFEGALNI